MGGLPQHPPASGDLIKRGANRVEQVLKDHGLTPRHVSIHNLDCHCWRIQVTALEETAVCNRPGSVAGRRCQIGDIDPYEVNEAFAPKKAAGMAKTHRVPIPKNERQWRAIGMARLAKARKLMATSSRAWARGKRYGLQTMCEGGGVANVTIVEAL
jgi:acetyl-CoA C-acetyltransferase